MSDGRPTISGCSSSGFNREQQEGPGQDVTCAPRRTNAPLRNQVRQKGREVDSSRVWYTHTFLLDAHKFTGERRISARDWASSDLLGGCRAARISMPSSEHTQSTITEGRIAQQEHSSLSFTQYTKLCVLHKGQTSSLSREAEVVA